MSLRNFSALTKTAGASIYAYACNLTNMDGTLVVGTAPLWLQIFDKASAPIANDIPVESYEIISSGPFPLASVFQSLAPITLATGFAVGISSVDQKYTAATATYSVLGQIEEGDQHIDGISGMGTTTNSTVNEQSNWTKAQGPKRLFALTIINGEAVSIYPMLFNADSTPTNGTVSNIPLVAIAAGATKSYYFGADGLIDPVLYGTGKGNFVALSSTSGTLTEVTGSLCTITAKFKV